LPLSLAANGKCEGDAGYEQEDSGEGSPLANDFVSG
jgi:hypothetical protein